MPPSSRQLASGTSMISDTAARGTQSHELHGLQRILRLAVAGYGQRERVGAARIDDARGKYEHTLGTDVGDKLPHVPAIDEDQGAVMPARADGMRVAKSKTQLHIMIGGQIQLEGGAQPRRARG